MEFKFYFAVAALCAVLPAWGQTDKDKVYISQCNDEYRFASRSGKIIVENSIETEFTSCSTMAQHAMSGVYYGDNISLDRAHSLGLKPAYRNVTPENVFYDDTKLCVFTLDFDKKGRKLKTSFERTFNDIRYFTRIYLSEPYYAKQKTVTLRIPTSVHGFRFCGQNLNAHVSLSKSLDGSDSVYTYTLHDLPAMRDEAGAPPASASQPYVIVLGSFASHNDLYRWSHEMASVDCSVPSLPALIQQITRGCSTDMDKIRATYAWVQQNIRYVAFEAGESGFRPDTPAEVIRKRYGDCKGMALLLKTLLKAQGYDARLTDIGTHIIPYTITDYPTLAATNHMICTLIYGGRNYYLDATYNHIPADYIPHHIQGQQALIENGDDCIVTLVPRLAPHTSVDSLRYDYHLDADGKAMSGTASYNISGDMKEYLLSAYTAATQTDKQTFLSNNLNSDSHSNEVTDARWENQSPQSIWAKASARVRNEKSVQSLDGELYVELNPHNNFFVGKVDTTERVNDYCLPLLCHVVREVSLAIPAGYALTYLPGSKIFDTAQGRLSCTFEQKGGHVVFRQDMQISNRRIARDNIVAWNEAVARWIDACNEQVIFQHK